MNTSEDYEEEEEPSFDPELCEEGGFDGIECDPNYSKQHEAWFCSTCNKRC